MKAAIVFCLLFAVAFCSTGVDVAVSVSSSDFKCLAGQGYSYAIVRCFHSTGHVDTECAPNAANAIAGGMQEVDIYVFPCPKCGNAASQIQAVVQYTQQNNVKYGTMWFDIEGGSTYWGSVASNQAFFKDMVTAAQSAGVNIGVYTSQSQWSPIMGSSTAGSSFPLWYAHYDGVESFSDFQAFAGWSKPDMKQYNGDKTACGVGIDENWMPGGPNSTSGHGSTSGGRTSTGHTTGGHTTGGHTTGGRTTTGHSTSGNSSTSNSGNSSTSNPSSTSSYSSGATSFTASGSGDFKLSSDTIYNKIGGRKDTTMTKTSARTKIDIMVDELDEMVENENHFQVSEEKMYKKFF